VVVQRPFKHGFQQQAQLYQSQEIACQILKAIPPEKVQVTIGIKELRGKLVGWLMQSWEELAAMGPMIKRGWEKCKLGRIHDPEFQAFATAEFLCKGLLAEGTLAEDTLCDDWAWLSLNRRSRQLLVTCGYERSVFFLVYDRGNRVDVCKAS
jgi:hypothetical protein